MLKIIATTGDFQTNLPNPNSNQEIGGSIMQSPRDRIHKSYDFNGTDYSRKVFWSGIRILIRLNRTLR